MSELAALEHVLRQRPEDEAAWVAYGKRLKVQGDPRAELIDLELRVRAKEDGANRALDVARRKLRGELGLSDDDGVQGDFTWARFRVYEVSRNHAAALTQLARYPLVDAADLDLAALSGTALPTCLDGLARLRPRQLRLDELALSEEEVALLLESPAIATLEQLVLQPASDSFDGDALLARLGPQLSQLSLKQLGLWNLNLGAAGLRTLAKHGPWRSLEYLMLGHNNEPLGAGVCRLLDGVVMPRLSGLAVASSEVEPGALSELALQPGVARLESLSMWQSHAGERFWSALATSHNVRSLRFLNADESDLTDELALGLSRSRALKLTRLDMMFTTLSVSTAVALLKSQRQLTLRCQIVQRELYQKLRLRRFGKRFILGLPIDCGSVGWPFRWHFQMDPRYCSAAA